MVCYSQRLAPMRRQRPLLQAADRSLTATGGGWNKQDKRSVVSLVFREYPVWRCAYSKSTALSKQNCTFSETFLKVEGAVFTAFVNYFSD